VLLTHIHLDHGGGTAALLEAFPGARWYCHESGRKHVIDPTGLWKGSQKVLGEVAEMYGPPGPLSTDSMVGDEAELAAGGIQAIHTPGHALHHVSFVHDDVLFVGEAFGTRIPFESGALYIRPATPPRFFLDQAIGSLDRLLALDPEPAISIFAHYGQAPGAFEYARAAKAQLRRWVDAIRELAAESTDGLEQRLFDRLMREDPNYGQGLYDQLPDDLKVRERHFLTNTLDGMLGYVRSS
jgi:glyoxylase-like metal-dependent hydrolase (beta-lactamase superfamily II)